MSEFRKAIVVGGGIGGLATAIALTRRGHHVEVLERAAEFGESGSGISLWTNGLRALDALGVGDKVRAAGHIETEAGIRDRSGRWLSKTDTAELARRYGPVVVVRRADLFAILAGALPADSLRAATTVTGIDTRTATVKVEHTAGTSEADLIIGADGIRSMVRATLWPDAKAPRYAGYTAWRMITAPLDFVPAGGEIWGRGERFGIAPLADGSAYLFGVASVPAAERRSRSAAATGQHADVEAATGGQESTDTGMAIRTAADEFAEVQRRFAHWPDPVPALLAAVSPNAVLRHDIYDLPPLDSFIRPRAALLGDAAHAMTPNMGQGANQALEDAVTLAAVLDGRSLDAALTEYDLLRRPRTQAIARRSHLIGQVAQWSFPPATLLRDTIIRCTPSSAMLDSLRSALTWEPPR
ncbi:FAD-dependent monooxygenase [Nocardia huaxiensis]|uniref:FAD-dependent monooxygenase n=1 Tax=Nocardia huaxiensis TaxID=2755382 RepID=A0A7D6Z3F8_9NOCA|nr:FAD-dependent monooxygenase [Nocardia huaxiensis]QLY30064.1 FAD-dependent monooxygenase [Nocardia huaxiensis]